MHEDDKTGRAGTKDPVEEAATGSFPASDPPAWTATRAGKPESPAAKDARKLDEHSPPRHCEALGLFASEVGAQAAAAALLAAGFNSVDIGPPRRHGNLEAGIGPARKNSSLGLYAALGALAAGALAALFAPRGTRALIAAAAGGAVGAFSARAAANFAEQQAAEDCWPQNCWLLRVHLKSPEDQERALTIIERQGAQKMHVSWTHAR